MTFLRDTAGKEKVSGLSSVMAGVAGLFNVRMDGLDTHFLRKFNALRYSRQPNSSAG